MTPEYLKIIIGQEKILSMPFNSVVASMTHQFLSSTEDENFVSDTYYYVFVNASKQIEKWLLDCIDEEFYRLHCSKKQKINERFSIMFL